jgi:hypothetical protein
LGTDLFFERVLKFKLKKTLLKVAAWRITSITTTLIFTLILTGNIKQATSFTLMLHAILMTVHTAFEVIWEKIEEKK